MPKKSNTKQRGGKTKHYSRSKTSPTNSKKMHKKFYRRSSKSRSPTRRSHKGGAIVMPSEYWGNNSGRYFEPGSPQLQIGDSAYGPNIPTSHGIPINNVSMGPELGPTHHSGLQTGGKYKLFKQIMDPENGKMYDIHSRDGKRVLTNYLRRLNLE